MAPNFFLAQATIKATVPHTYIWHTYKLENGE